MTTPARALGFTPEQRAIYDQVTHATRSLDEQMITLYELVRDRHVNAEDANAVRRWLSDQVDRNVLRR